MSLQIGDVEKEYKNDQNLKRDDVRAILKWLKKQPHLPKITEFQAALFLQSCYYQMEATKQTIENYFTLRTRSSYLFDSASEDVIKHTLTYQFLGIFPKRTADNYIILSLKLLDFNPANYDFINAIKLLGMVALLYIFQHGLPNGQLVIFDMKGTTLGHIGKVNLMALKHALHFLQEGLPVRLKGIHFINISPLTDKVISLAKQFLKSEIMDIIKLHPKSIDSLYEFMPPECLPEDYGGELPSIAAQQEENIKNILAHMNFFKQLDTQKVDETKRPVKINSKNPVFGVAGSFKKLEID